MKEYFDSLYGWRTLPGYLRYLINTKEMIRLRNINQAVLPNCLNQRGPIPSRFQHSMGVFLLAIEVIKNNRHLIGYELLLPVAGLLHDTGSPPFSHLSEPFLKQMTGKDGEQFLEDILDGSETALILNELGIKTSAVLELVTGNSKPFSEILNGSVDIDNLDNVARYKMAAGLPGPKFDPLRTAGAFRFTDGAWFLDQNAYDECKKWQEARRIVYEALYDQNHLSVAMMVYRALEIAYHRGDISKEFFQLDDNQAIEHLWHKCNQLTAYLIERAMRWEWYPEIASLEYRVAVPSIFLRPDYWNTRCYLANALAKILAVPENRVCVYLNKGRDRREITVPFLGSDGKHRQYENTDSEPVYRAKVFVETSLAESAKSREKIRSMTEEILLEEG